MAGAVGSRWPQGSETTLWQMAEFFRVAAAKLEDLIPELQRVRSNTQEVLWGQTGQAAERQFALLFGGEYSVAKLVIALRVLANLLEKFGTIVQGVKLNIVATLGVTAFQINSALASYPLDPAGSQAQESASPLHSASSSATAAPSGPRATSTRERRSTSRCRGIMRNA